MNLIPRFYDATKGEVRIFGRNIKEYDIEKSAQGTLALVLQKAVLFKGTIEENLRWGNESATMEELEEALEISQSKEFVQSKVGQMEFQIEQSGRNLSGGQKQRLNNCEGACEKT